MWSFNTRAPNSVLFSICNKSQHMDMRVLSMCAFFLRWVFFFALFCMLLFNPWSLTTHNFVFLFICCCCSFVFSMLLFCIIITFVLLHRLYHIFLTLCHIHIHIFISCLILFHVCPFIYILLSFASHISCLVVFVMCVCVSVCVVYPDFFEYRLATIWLCFTLNFRSFWIFIIM